MEALISRRLLKLTKLMGMLALLMVPALAFPQATNANSVALPGMSINFGQGVNLVDSLEVLMLFTVITLAPSILILCTSFTRILIVLSFMRQAIGTQNMPPNQVLVGFSLFLSLFVMQPTGERIYNKAIQPYMQKPLQHLLQLMKSHLHFVHSCKSK